MERVLECHHVAGGDAFILKVVAASVEELGPGGGEAARFRLYRPPASCFSSPVQRRALHAE